MEDVTNLKPASKIIIIIMNLEDFTWTFSEALAMVEVCIQQNLKLSVKLVFNDVKEVAVVKPLETTVSLEDVVVLPASFSASHTYSP